MHLGLRLIEFLVAFGVWIGVEFELELELGKVDFEIEYDLRL